MHIESMIMAEAIAQDAEGIFSLIRMGQDVLLTREFPSQTKRAVVLLLEEDENGEDQDGKVYEVSYSFKDPAGEVLVAQTVSMQLGPKRFPELHGGVWVPAEMLLTVHGPGTHQLQATIRQGAEEVDRRSVSLHVKPAG